MSKFDEVWESFTYVDMKQCAEYFWKKGVEKAEAELQVAKAQIAMKDEALKIAKHVFDEVTLRTNVDCSGPSEDVQRVISDTSASTEAWLRERDAKVLENAAEYLDNHCCATGHVTSDSTLQELLRMAAELRKNGRS